MPTRYTGKFTMVDGGCSPVGEAEVTVLNAPPPRPCSICGVDHQSNVEFFDRHKSVGYGCHPCVYQMFAEAKAEHDAQKEDSRGA